MKTALYTHPACLGHLVPPGAPEVPGRLESVLKALEAPEFGALTRLSAPPASDSDMTRVHDPAYWTTICEMEPDTPGAFVELIYDAHLHQGTIEAVRHATGAALAAMRAVGAGEFEAAFCATRPPGHHAEPAQAMGFCFTCHAAIAAKAAVEEGYCVRAAVIDFDVHHGNGTQACLWNEPQIFYGSIHKSPLYPGTGRFEETGAHDNVANAPFGKVTAEEWRKLFDTRILTALRGFAPDMVFISAGFDAHQEDPLGSGPLLEEDFVWATEELVKIARLNGSGRLVSILEGGYDLDALGRSAAAHVRALMDA